MSVEFHALPKITLTGGGTFDPLTTANPIICTRNAILTLDPGASGATFVIKHKNDADADAVPFSKGLGVSLGMSGSADTKNSEYFILNDYRIGGTAGDDVFLLYETEAAP